MLTELLEKALLEIPERDDSRDGRIHVSDVACGCNRFKWSNIHEGVVKQFDAKTKMKFERGYLWEDLFDRTVAKELEKQGWQRIAFETSHVSENDVVGHEDRLYEHKEVVGSTPTAATRRSVSDTFKSVEGRAVPADVDDSIKAVSQLERQRGNSKRLLVELKSSSSRYKPDQAKCEENSTQYFIQAAGYAKMPKIRADFAKVFVYYSPLDEVGEYEVDIPRFYKMYQERLKVMKSALGETPPQPVLPAWTLRSGKSYLCGTKEWPCPVTSCHLNPAQKALV